MALNKQQVIQNFTKLFPLHREKIERFYHLQSVDNKPYVAVFGKYNHGKSTLLNALINKEGHFKVSDIRETITNANFQDNTNGIIWLDTPGLDADVTGKDDFEANKGAFVSADIVLIIHSLRTGELDRNEVKHIENLLNHSQNTDKLLVITQIDQVPDKQHQEQAIKRIKEQLPQFEPILVSSNRYLKGIKENKHQLVEMSGIDNLRNKINNLKENVKAQRNQEIQELKKELNILLDKEISNVNNELRILNEEKNDARSRFEHDINQILKTI